MAEIIISHIKLWTSEECFKEDFRTSNVKTIGARMAFWEFYSHSRTDNLGPYVYESL
jgi:hypothetical protein